MAGIWEKMGLTPLEFLMRAKFPNEKLKGSTAPGLDPSSRVTFDEAYYRRAAEYRHALSVLSEQDRLVLVHEEERIRAELRRPSEAQMAAAKREAEEAAQFYNQPEVDADFEAWARTPFWSLAEALALSFGKDPEIVNWERLKDFVLTSDFAKQFKNRRRIFTRAAQSNALSAVLRPRVFLAWAEQTRLQIPAALANAIREYSVDVEDWKIRHDVLLEKHKIQIRELERQLECPDKRSLRSLLKMILGMAVAWKQHDPSIRRNSKATEIQSSLELNGIEIDINTVRYHLSEASRIFPEIKYIPRD